MIEGHTFLRENLYEVMLITARGGGLKSKMCTVVPGMNGKCNSFKLRDWSFIQG